MCGISLVVSQTEAYDGADSPECSTSLSDILKTKLSTLLTARGPDAQNAVGVAFPANVAAIDDSGNSPNNTSNVLIVLWMFGSVLHIQGESVTTQPCVDQHGNILLWNGEVFGQDDESNLNIQAGESDTAAVSRMLAFAADSIAKSDAAPILHSEHCRAITTAITHCLATIHGPYAFVYYHKATNSIHFGRDPFGRRSLVLGYAVPLIDAVCRDMTTGVDIVIDAQNPFVLSSVCPPKTTVVEISGDSEETDATTAVKKETNWEEVNITGVHCLHNKPSRIDSVGSIMNLSCIAWPVSRIRVGRGLNSTPNKANYAAGNDSGIVFSETLQAAVQRRVNSMPSVHNPVNTTKCYDTSSIDHSTDLVDGRSRVGVLFSGGIDSVLLTALLHHSTAPGLSIDLLNVTFIKTSGTNGNSGSTPSPDRVAAIAALLELQTIFPSRDWRLVHIDVTEEERFAHEQHIMDLIRPSDTHMDLNIGTAFWFASRGKGYLRTYSTAELSALFAATTDNGVEDCEDGGENKRDKTTHRNNKQGRPLLRHGASGAAAGVGRSESKNNNTELPAALAPVLTELSSGKFKCTLESCSRVYKTGCVNYLCKKCCDLHHRNTVLGSDYCDESTDTTASMKNRLRFLELDTPNPCPAHRAKPKQVNKMKANIENNMSKLVIAEAVEEEDSLSAVEYSPLVPTETIDNITQDDTVTTKAHENTDTSSPTITATLHTTHSPEIIPYQCHCKALLVGIGADEQMAGYGRHRTVYLKALKDAQDNRILAGAISNTGTETDLSSNADEGSSSSHSAQMQAECEAIATAALEAELNKDLHRLWKRNLGRDDRCISDNGREAWFPFLDEQVVALLQSLPMDQICDLSQAQGVGDKRILRSAARHLGLAQCTELVKRAIQFGTRVAQHTNQHYHGSNRKGKGDTKIEE